ncbi:thiamine pyrophosphate enzyme, N-terminal TPP binding domain-containing protein [Umbelopsis sp. AD052]|nr:thiamine pyrophosphate enzyme, N-terminal TPP binding domain-containing protein [Umbelopsis sp. AD052]
MSKLTGSELIAATLKRQGVHVIFGIVGIPVIDVAEACIQAGIRFIGFRNEQSAAYAASAYGYLTGKPGVCLTVGGPGVIHALAGIVNSQINCWPMVLLAGSSDTDQLGMGAFQELDQVEACKPYTKYATRPSSLATIPFAIEKALRTSAYGRPGACYVDLPADFIQAQIQDPQYIEKVQVAATAPAPKYLADPEAIKAAVDALRSAKSPLIVVGKGAAYARAESELKALIEKSNIPFLPTPMAKGLLSDTHPLCTSAARSTALKQADVVLLVGARLNWILHFGHSPRWSNNVKFIQIDIEPEEMNSNGAVTIPLVGHIPSVLDQLSQASLPRLPDSNAFLKTIKSTVHANVQKGAAKAKQGDDNAVMNYHSAFDEIKRQLPSKDVVFVSEGANTMDIARSVFDVHEPRCRLDAATFATMGVGMGFAIAAQVYYPEKRIVSIVGDSAFGFSAMELETAARAKLPLLILVINNNGIYHGLDNNDYQESRSNNTLPSTALSPDTRYDLIAEACGGRGWLAKNRKELRVAMAEALATKDTTCLINVVIAPGGRTKLVSEGGLWQPIHTQ